MTRFVFLVAIAALISVGCSTASKKDAKLYAAGEKAQVDRVTYHVVDMQTVPKMDVAGEARIPKERFYLTQISIFNGGNTDFVIPAMVLYDDAGGQYPELGDGRGSTDWIGVSRKVAPGETLLGTVLFDAPVKHYKLRISDEFSDQPILVDMPLGIVQEKGEMPIPDSPLGNSIIKVVPSQSSGSPASKK